MTSKLKLYRNNVVNLDGYPLRNDYDKGIQNINGTHAYLIGNKTGVYVITFDTSINKYKVLMARKCKVGERFEVGHTFANLQQVSVNTGAAGTNKDYWGKWVSIGGTNSRTAWNSYDAAISEFNDETASNDAATKLTFLAQYNWNNMCIYIAYYPYNNSHILLNRSRKDLIFSSHGEIAELKWHIIGENLDDVTNYIQTTYNTYLIPFINGLGMYPLINLIQQCNGNVPLQVEPLANLVSTQTFTNGISVPTSVSIPYTPNIPNDKWLPSNFPYGSKLDAITPTGIINSLKPDQMTGFGAAIFNNRGINSWQVHGNYTNAFNYPRQYPRMKFYRSINNNYYMEAYLSNLGRWSHKWLIQVHPNNTSYTAV